MHVDCSRSSELMASAASAAPCQNSRRASASSNRASEACTWQPKEDNRASCIWIPASARATCSCKALQWLP
eukprot:CAMPEP_0170316316 /NCGR_PEP_ID=MMETSP0116_2-20130129/58785_1 /TAXON_ID=400756 /ORGANISM="Durinskia baltica, Strain CSIRO CS-38" /LENGTH=70 /DNA_ID=CAMNT_0010568873 /DNA_START=58 /DNA_END=266 /DNA_ORIENTATION=-